MPQKVTTLDIAAIRNQAKEGYPVPPSVALKLCGEVERLHKLLEEVRREAVEEHRLVRV